VNPFALIAARIPWSLMIAANSSAPTNVSTPAARSSSVWSKSSAEKRQQDNDEDRHEVIDKQPMQQPMQVFPE
jgi:hypothetical protein